jgi:hypothetical protein
MNIGGQGKKLLKFFRRSGKGDIAMMKKSRRATAFFVAAIMVLFFSLPGFAGDVADVILGSQTIHFQPKVGYNKLVVRVSAPDGNVHERIFKAGADAVIQLPGNAPDGSYVYEIRALYEATATRDNTTVMTDARLAANSVPRVQDGHFRVLGGSIVLPTSETPNRVDDIVHLDDVIITSSLCVGFDCINGESFGFDTLRLKENNLRIHFYDTSNSASFPTNDWRIVINDSANGGASYFGIEDSSSGKRVFTIEAAAPANSFYLDDYGRIGMGTSTPVVELEIAEGDTPTVRLNQDGSSGWAPQTWDVAGNEANFFIRDVSNGSRLTFRIQPGAPTNTLTLKSTGYVGIGTWEPEAMLEVEGTAQDVQLLVQRTDGATGQLTAKSGVVNFGSKGAHPLRLMVNQEWKMNLNDDNSLTMQNGASCSAVGVWTNASSIEYKENIQELNAIEAIDTLKGLKPVKYNYKADKNEEYVGFIAEEVPELVATGDRKGMSPMDVVGVLTKVLQEQQKTIEALQKEVEELKKK